MQIKKVSLDELKPVEKFRLSFPLKGELYDQLKGKLAPLPLIIVNHENEIVFGLDDYDFLKRQRSDGETQVDVIQADFSDKDALILNYNMKGKLTGLNLYEKLVFIQKILPLAEPAAIYRKTDLDIGINRELTERLDMLLGEAFKELLIDGGVMLKYALALCNFNPEDRTLLIELFRKVSFTASQQQKIVEMVEEILFRDKCTLAEIWEKLQINPGEWEMEKPQKEIIDRLFKYRYPVYMEAEETWQAEIDRMRLPSNVNVTHYPFFEKRGIDITIHAKDMGEFQKLMEKITGN
ncbi:MAG: hypothetical protein ACM3SY_02660 [Candidatus Omnitrophota bacterium]